MLAGLMPLILWEGFSLLYFGFIFPNTYYTKLYTGIPSSEYIAQGIRYLENSFHLDPITLCVIVSSVILAFVYSLKNKKPHPFEHIQNGHKKRVATTTFS